MEAPQPAASSAKFVALFGPPTDAAAFERYYAETHLLLVRAVPGLQRFESALVLGTAEGGTAPYHRVAELWFADVGRLQAMPASPEGQALVADLANFATGGVTILVTQVDAVIERSPGGMPAH